MRNKLQEIFKKHDADMFLNDYSLGQSVPREIFYYFDEKWTVACF